MQTINSIDFDATRQFDCAYLERTIAYYEAIVTAGYNSSQNYWNLGIAYLLQQREIDAQATWYIPLELASELETEILTNELVTTLDRVATQKINDDLLDDAWLISQYLRELNSTHLSNLLRLLLLEIKFERFSSETLVDWSVIEVIANTNERSIDCQLLQQILESLLYFPSLATTATIRQCLASFLDCQTIAIDCIAKAARVLAHQQGTSSELIEILSICREFQPENTVVLQVLCSLYCDRSQYQQAIEVGFILYDLCQTLPHKIITNHRIISNLLGAGDWDSVEPILARHTQLLEEFVAARQPQIESSINQGIIGSIPLLVYAADRAEYYRSLQNKIAKIYLQHYQVKQLDRHIEPAPLAKPVGVIRVGYIGSTFRSHSVGWLSRWLWQYHDRSRFQIFTYCINQNPEDPFYQQWFRDRSDCAYCFGINADEISAQIRADEIDILIDLDSITLDITCAVLVTKPAPIQVSWLGWDATGLPTVDYFIADRYVLPANAQDYYREKIWYLPKSYLAVDGFEIGIPTISRQDLALPPDAVIYWSGQRGYKRHPDTVRAQMRILKSVPNSYFLIKGDTDPTIIEKFFGQIAAEEEVDCNRLRFLGTVADELTHRANLAIADIVLDTFPYNGATTTLETLWMGIPMVTQVGQQFAARNSYTFMLNAGIEEGIAWSAAEYVEWGIKLGLDRQLRMEIREKLRVGRQTAPVWNAKQFTLDMEQAYRQMWAIYQHWSLD